MTATTAYRVELDVYRGPLDLLLYLVRKHEVDIMDIPVATIAQQYIDYLDVLEHLNVDDVGEFLVVASTLIEIKSRQILPSGGEEEEPDEARQDLVRQLLEYKRYRDAASVLEERGRDWQMRLPRQAHDLPTRTRDLAEEPIHEVELWDLVSAFSRIMRDNEVTPGTNIVYDETPIEVYIERLKQRLIEERKLALSELFRAGMHKSTLVGLFLAVLELVRHQGVLTEQEDLFSEIWLVATEGSFKTHAEREESAANAESADGEDVAAADESAAAPETAMDGDDASDNQDASANGGASDNDDAAARPELPGG